MQPELTQQAELCMLVEKYPDAIKSIIYLYKRKYQLDGVDALIKDLTHAKQPILTTEDGYEVWNEKTELFCVNPITFATTELTAKRANESACVYYYLAAGRISYIIQNKPLFSLSEAITAIDNHQGTIREVLTELAKSKV